MRSPFRRSLEFGPTVDSGGSLDAGTGTGTSPGSGTYSVGDERSGFIPLAAESSTSLHKANAIDEQEQVADVLRLRTVMSAALLLWGVTSLLDWSVVRFVQPGPLSYFLWLRAGSLAIMSAAVSRLWIRPLPGRMLLSAIDLTIFVTSAMTASLLCLRYRGIASPYAHALSCILVVRGITLPNHYKRGIPMVLPAAIMFPLTMGVASLFLPDIRAQFTEPSQLAVFVQNVTLILVTGALTVLGGHSMWALRRQVFSARNIGRYKLQHRIGQGGMGEVWKAYHPSLRRAVAIKLLRAHETSPHALQRFEREVRATSELKHPNTIRVFDFGVTDDGLWYYAMELLEGETVGLLIEREGPLPAERAIKLMRQACRAIAEAHGRGIVHRDIKPDNLFVTSLGGEFDFIKVLDFGIAKLMDDEILENGKVTVEGALLGTPAFMSPEQFEGHAIDARTDVFSLGAVLYFMLAGQAPYQGQTLATIRAAHFKPYKPPSEISTHLIPEILDQILEKCLQREPSRRYADAGELDYALSIVEHIVQELEQALPSFNSATSLERAASQAGENPAQPAPLSEDFAEKKEEA